MTLTTIFGIALAISLAVTSPLLYFGRQRDFVLCMQHRLVGWTNGSVGISSGLLVKMSMI